MCFKVSGMGTYHGREDQRWVHIQVELFIATTFPYSTKILAQVLGQDSEYLLKEPWLASRFQLEFGGLVPSDDGLERIWLSLKASVLVGFDVPQCDTAIRALLDNPLKVVDGDEQLLVKKRLSQLTSCSPGFPVGGIMLIGLFFAALNMVSIWLPRCEIA